MTNQNTALPSLVTCLFVRLTDKTSENLNMVVPHAKATAEAPATAVKRTLVGSYDDRKCWFRPITRGGRVSKTQSVFAAIPQGCKPCGEAMRGPWPRTAYLQAVITAHGFQFFAPNVK